ncbi:MAG TPA: ferredoxin family protein [Candidatus Dormibacteraeota bacterium]|nr:ferredoxin family protein [Candidatus Dormibacteraeota bacterium]
MDIHIASELCKSCSYCCQACPKGIIQLSTEINSKGYHYAAVTNVDECTGCKFCAIVCPEIAIEIEKSNVSAPLENGKK